MICHIWEYEVEPGSVADFEMMYGKGGAWAELLAKGLGYQGTELQQERGDPNRFVTLDYWESHEAWQSWRHSVSADYEQLDRIGEAFTVSERFVGSFEVRSGNRAGAV